MASSSSPRLFHPLRLGGSHPTTTTTTTTNTTLSHRLVMAPMTRLRASADGVPSLPLMKDYYVQRASSLPGTLLITEASFPSVRAGGYPHVPGFWAAEQLAAWREITTAVHEAGGLIFAQLGALGRVCPGATAAAGGFRVMGPSGSRPLRDAATGNIADGLVAPEEMGEADIRAAVSDFAAAARNAVTEAGFDGVELHGANGYLVDQFLQANSNAREDGYGGSVEGRARFALETLEAMVEAVGGDAGRVAVRLSPWSTFQGMRMPDDAEVEDQFGYLVRELRARMPGLAYLHLIEPRVQSDQIVETSESNEFAMEAWYGGSSSGDGNDMGPVLLAGGFTPENAREVVEEQYEKKDREVGVVFGRHFLSTPDLPYRVKNGLDLQPYNRDTFYIPMSPEGYTDYPFSKEWLAENAA